MTSPARLRLVPHSAGTQAGDAAEVPAPDTRHPLDAPDAPPREPDAIESIVREIEAGLAMIEFPEVTEEDRVTFLEAAVEWHARCARRLGLAGLGTRLREFVDARRRQLLSG